MEYYLQSHKSFRYLPPSEKIIPGIKKYSNRFGWDDFYMGQYLIFSHRKTTYDLTVFPEKLHSHSFYEMDIYEEGNISYISDNQEIFPQKNDIILFPPGRFHTARLSEKSEYNRYVFYFDAQIFGFLGKGCLPKLFKTNSAGCYRIDKEKRGEFFYLLEKLEAVLYSGNPECCLLAFSYVLQFFYLINGWAKLNQESVAQIPQRVQEVKKYVDTNYQELNTTSEIANHFFYSREYVSRIFKQYYNINLSEYLVNKKITRAKQALEQGGNVTYAFNASGFRSMSSFVKAFRMRTSMTPSEYKRQVHAK